MKTISIAAPCNGSGKTSLILSLVRTFPGLFAVTKFTTIYKEEQFCPVKDHDCACRRLSGNYIICKDPEILSQPDTDTGKIFRAGARLTLWCVARHEGYPQMVKELLSEHFPPEFPLLMEGNTVVRHLKPELLLYIVNPLLPRSWWKSDTEHFLAEADWIVINPYSNGKDPVSEETSTIVNLALAPYREKCIELEKPPTLSGWADRRLYQAVSGILDGGAGTYCQNRNEGKLPE